MFLIDKTLSWYGRYERPISSFSLVFGFVFDAVTLKRVDMFWENFWVIVHLAVVAICITLLNVHHAQAGADKDPNKAHFWYVNILQFAFGGLLSTYLVFYFRSADIFTAWPFLLLLVLVFIGNESLKHRYTRFTFQIGLFFLSIYSFAIFLVPVVLHQIGSWVFILSGILSVVFITIFIWALSRFAKNSIAESKKLITALIAGILILFNFLYFTNLIPPIPLSLKDAGVYHDIEKSADGNYTVTHEDHGILGYFHLYPNFSETPDAPVYVYSAIFSPQGLDTTIVHEWQHYNSAQKKWTTEGMVALPVVGGRDGGFRTYSSRTDLAAGKWRVNIETTQGKGIGSVRFNISSANETPALLTEVKE